MFDKSNMRMVIVGIIVIIVSILMVIIRVKFSEKDYEKKVAIKVSQEEIDAGEEGMGAIFGKMKQAVENYNYAEGAFVFGNGNVENFVEFEADLDNVSGWERIILVDKEIFISVKDGVRVYESDEMRMVDENVFTREDKSLHQEMIGVMEGEEVYALLKENSTNLEYSAMVLYPQKMAEFLLGDFSKWEIIGNEEILMRDCCIIQGCCNFMVEDENVTCFKIWVDIVSGAVMKYEGYNVKGDVMDYIYITEFECR